MITKASGKLPMKHSLRLLTLFAALASAPTYAADQILKFDGLGPVRIGMTQAEAEAALGTKLKSIYPDMPASCWFGNRADRGDETTSYWIENGKIVLISIDDHVWPNPEKITPPVITANGIRIDSTMNDLKKAYGSRLDIDFHRQGDHGDENYLYVKLLSENKKHGILFEIWEGKVKSIRAGTSETYYIDEPCL